MAEIVKIDDQKSELKDSTRFYYRRRRLHIVYSNIIMPAPCRDLFQEEFDLIVELIKEAIFAKIREIREEHEGEMDEDGFARTYVALYEDTIKNEVYHLSNHSLNYMIPGYGISKMLKLLDTQPDRDDYPSVREIVQLIMHDTLDEMSLEDLYEEYKDWIAFHGEDN